MTTVAVIIIIIILLSHGETENACSSGLFAVPARPSRKGWLDVTWSLGK
jgi:preprotein translocase subunit SecG